MASSLESLDDAFGALMAFMVTMLLLIMHIGWVTWFMWGWFMVPLGLPAIGFWHATGIALITRLLIWRPPETYDKDKIVRQKQFGLMVIIPIMIWIIGYIIAHWFMG